MPRGGSRKHPADCKCGNCPAIGRKKLKPEASGAPKKYEAAEIIESVGQGQLKGHEKFCSCWKCLWVRDCERFDKEGQSARKYVWDRHSGKAVDTVNHIHDKPLDVNVTVSFAELVRKIRQRKEEYERSRG